MDHASQGGFPYPSPSGKQRTLLQNWTGSGRFGSHARSVAAATRPDQLTCFSATRPDKIASEREAFIVDLAAGFLRRSRFGNRTSSDRFESSIELDPASASSERDP